MVLKDPSSSVSEPSAAKATGRKMAEKKTTVPKKSIFLKTHGPIFAVEWEVNFWNFGEMEWFSVSP